MSTAESASLSWGDRYLTFIQDIITKTLKGQIRAKTQVYQLLAAQLQPGTGEIFERCLAEQTTQLQQQLAAATDELKQAKLERQLRAIKTLQEAWGQWQQNHQAQSMQHEAIQAIMAADLAQRLLTLIQILDPNQSQPFSHGQIQELAVALSEAATALPNETEAFELRQFAAGLTLGLASYGELEGHLVGWLYDSPNRAVGFEAVKTAQGPWNSWASQTTNALAKALFAGQAQNQSAATIAQTQATVDWNAWVSLVVLLRGMQNGLVSWFDQQPYSAQAGQNLAGVTFLVFAMIWSEFSSGFHQNRQLPTEMRDRLTQVCFRISLQVLRAFARRENFPLYGGVFASFSGMGFRDTIAYLDQPLKAVENTQEKARILTVLGYSQRWVGNHQRAAKLHQEALELARQASDQRCEVANLNHLSRLSLHQKNYGAAVMNAQRALILARQGGDRQGEANALASLGYSEVMMARQQEAVTSEMLESSLNYLQRGQQLSEKLEDLQSHALACVGLGVAYVALEQGIQAQQALEQGLVVLQRLGDRDLEAFSHAYLGEAHYQLKQLDVAVYHACLGMYLLEQRQHQQWQQAASLVVILQSRLAIDSLADLLAKYRGQLVARIGVDGFDHLPVLLDRYRQG